MRPTVAKPCRWYRGTFLGLVDSRYAGRPARSTTAKLCWRSAFPSPLPLGGRNGGDHPEVPQRLSGMVFLAGGFEEPEAGEVVGCADLAQQRLEALCSFGRPRR